MVKSHLVQPDAAPPPPPAPHRTDCRCFDCSFARTFRQTPPAVQGVRHG